MGVTPAGRICQTVVSRVVRGVPPCRILTKGEISSLDRDGVPLDIVHVDDVSVVASEPKIANQRCNLVPSRLGAAGLPTEAAKFRPATQGAPFVIMLGLALWKGFLLAPRPPALKKLRRAIEDVLSLRVWRTLLV